MKAILICPAERRAVAAFAEPAPLSNLPFLGKTLVQYWLEHLALNGAREVYVLAVDRPEQVLAHVGSGARWGLEVSVFNELHELTPQEAIAEYEHGDEPRAILSARGHETAEGPRPRADSNVRAPDLVNTMDHLPGFPGHALFESYAGFVAAQQALMPLLAGPDRVGLRQIEPGVWVGLRARVSNSAELRAPCWVGDEALIGRGAVIGPMAVIETRSVIEAGAEVTHSIVGPDTLVGEYTSLVRSIAWGSTLINWQLNSCVRVADRFLICSLAKPPRGNTATPKRRHAEAARCASPGFQQLSISASQHFSQQDHAHGN